MTRFLKYAAAALGPGLLVFGICAFVQWEIDPGMWDRGSRFSVAVLSIVSGSVVTIFVAHFSGDFDR